MGRRRLVASLLPTYSDADLLRIANERRAAKGLAPYELWPDRPTHAPRATRSTTFAPPLPNDIVGFRGVRKGDVLTLVIPGPPRTKKNSKTHVANAGSPAFKQWRNHATAGLRRLGLLELPLPDQAYNLAALFFTDSRGSVADLDGLLTGLCDVLEHAGVISDDWWFRGYDRSRSEKDTERPRVELVISPLLTPA